MKYPIKPPRFAHRFLSWFCREDLLEEIEGDLYEVYSEDVRSMSSLKAKSLYFLRVLGFFKPSNIRPTKTTNHMMLFKNYLLIAYRNLIRNKGYAAFNLLGLTVGLSVSILMVTYVVDELSFDKQFTGYQEIYRVAHHLDMENSEMRSAATPASLGATLADEFPEVEAFAAFTMYNRVTLKVSDKKFTDPQSHLVSSSFLQVFDYPLIKGDAETALDEPNTMVISESKAMSYFGTLDVIGQAVESEHSGIFTITGVMKDPFENAHSHHPILFHADDEYFTGQNWKDNGYYNYIKLKAGTDVDQLRQKLPDFYKKHMEKPVKEVLSGTGHLFLQPLTEIHLHSDLAFELEPNSKFYHVVGMGLLAGFIVLVVCINYMNMATAQATKRVREVGIRKVLGSNRQMLLFQFFTESGVLITVAAVLALLFIPVFLPYFNYLADKSFTVFHFLDVKILTGFALIVLVTGLLGGSYPAIFLSKFTVDQVLKKSYSFSGFRLPLNKLLNAFQFMIALVMIIVTLTVYRQVEFAKHKDLGFNQENVLKIDLKNRTNDEYALIQELLAHPDIQSVAASKQAPGDDIQLEGFPFEMPEGSFSTQKAEFNAVDKNYIPVLGLKLIAGRNIGDENPGTVAVINQTLAKRLGYSNPKDALDKRVKLPIGEDFYSRIIGVTKDVHMRSLHHEIAPHILINFTPITSMLLVNVKTQNMRNLLGFVEDKTREVTNSTSHAVSFLDQDYWDQYQTEEKRTKIMSIFSLLIVSLAFAGLIGLVSFQIRFRAKEITIRKVFGAGFGNVLSLYVRQFVWQILISVAIAVPVTIYFINQWLDNFAYRIGLPYDLLMVASTVLIFSVFLVMLIQIKLSFRVNPTTYLKEE